MASDTVQHGIAGTSATQIAASVESGVESGALPAGTALPSVRQLAERLGVSPTTVASAYRQLRERGTLVTQERSRTTVSHRPPLPTRPAPPLPAGVRDLADGSPDPVLLPDLMNAARRLVLPQRTYGDEMAVGELLDVGRDRLRADGIAAEHLVVVSGALDGLERVLAAHLRIGDRVAVEDPGYSGVLDLCRAMGLQTVAVAVDDAGPSLPSLSEALDGGACAVVLTPRAQNPLGAALEPARAAQLRELLAGYPEVLVVEDDHAGEVAGAPALTLTGERDRWAVLRSVSKSLGADLRLALLTGDRTTTTRVAARQRLGAGWVSHVLQRLTLDLWTDPDVIALLGQASRLYAERRDALIAALAGSGIASHGRSGLNVWIPVPEEGPVLRGLLQCGWALQGGDAYRIVSPPGVRVTTARLPVVDAPALAADLAALLSAEGRTRQA